MERELDCLIRKYMNLLKKSQNLFSNFLARSNIIIWYNYVQWDSFTREFAINNIVGRIYMDFKYA